MNNALGAMFAVLAVCTLILVWMFLLDGSFQLSPAAKACDRAGGQIVFGFCIKKDVILSTR